MRNESGNIYLKILVNLILFIIGVLCLIFVFPKIVKFFLPFLIGWIIATIANPLVKFLEKKVKILRKHSSAIIIVITIGVIIGIIYGSLSFLIHQISAFIKDIPNISILISERFDQLSLSLRGLIEILPEGTKDTVEQILPGIQNQINSFVASKKIPESTISFARGFVDWLFMLLIIFVSSYFFIKDRDLIIKKVRSIMPTSVLDGYDMIVYNFKTAIGGYFKAQFKIMLILIFIMFVGFKMVQVPYGFLIATLTGILDFLPVFGTGAVLWPWALAEVILGDYVKALTLIIIYLVCQIVKNILQPKMVGDSVGMNPLLTLLFMYIGYRFKGVLGLIIAIPLGMVLVNLFRAGMFHSIIRGFKILIHDINRYRKF